MKVNSRKIVFYIYCWSLKVDAFDFCFEWIPVELSIRERERERERERVGAGKNFWEALRIESGTATQWAGTPPLHHQHCSTVIESWLLQDVTSELEWKWQKDFVDLRSEKLCLLFFTTLQSGRELILFDLVSKLPEFKQLKRPPSSIGAIEALNLTLRRWLKMCALAFQATLAVS